MSIHGHYLETPEGQLAQYRHRARRRMWFTIEGIEPRAKSSMPDDHKDAIQRQLLDSLVARRRRAFRGPLALRLTIHTTDKNPAHSHNIAKNLLDLFGRPRRILRTRRCALLYSDDNQVHALSVRCRHGETMPRIATEAIPLGGLIKDLQLIQGARAQTTPLIDSTLTRLIESQISGETKRKYAANSATPHMSPCSGWRKETRRNSCWA